MSLSIDIPKDAEAALREQWGNLEQAAKESLLIESYRTGTISLGFLAQLLGLTRWDAETWLGNRGVKWSYDVEDLAEDRRTVAELFGEGR
jgi:predicted HTH domain antitoxin